MARKPKSNNGYKHTRQSDGQEQTEIHNQIEILGNQIEEHKLNFDDYTATSQFHANVAITAMVGAAGLQAFPTSDIIFVSYILGGVAIFSLVLSYLDSRKAREQKEGLGKKFKEKETILKTMEVNSKK